MSKPFKDQAKRGTRIEVRNNDISGALRVMKKRMISEGIFREIRERSEYTKPSEKRNRAKKAARKRHLKELAQNRLN